MYKLNRRVTIERYDYEPDDHGGSTAVLSDSWEKWATVEQRMGRVIEQVNSVMWAYDTKIIMRRFASRPIRSNDMIVYDGTRYMVKSVTIEKESFKHFEVCKCEMVDNKIKDGSS